ncbi:hypothetical protein [Hyalangium minutum]|uniref:Uncharacterized protein n=1 Tax=Hyalangium minutum TaxID=394096 RepID=A0A085WUH7_9BACT|nr:hypothetical protein [Hyalangium minutum]KFE71340.1 hypothetical protein DB31_3470 [Hyalangium minutum]
MNPAEKRSEFPKGLQLLLADCDLAWPLAFLSADSPWSSRASRILSVLA